MVLTAPLLTLAYKGVVLGSQSKAGRPKYLSVKARSNIHVFSFEVKDIVISQNSS